MTSWKIKPLQRVPHQQFVMTKKTHTSMRNIHFAYSGNHGRFVCHDMSLTNPSHIPWDPEGPMGVSMILVSILRVCAASHQTVQSPPTHITYCIIQTSGVHQPPNKIHTASWIHTERHANQPNSNHQLEFVVWCGTH